MRRSDYTCIARGASFERATSGECVEGGAGLEPAGRAAEAEDEAGACASWRLLPRCRGEGAETPGLAWQALFHAAGGGQPRHHLLEESQAQAPRGGARRGCAPRRAKAAAVASACLALAACACWLGVRRPRARGALPQSAPAVPSKASAGGGGAGCDCAWASVSTCGQDDGGPCFEDCCFKTANRTCRPRGGCTCDCSWANQSSCNYDDGGCCFTCCCGAAFVGAGTGGPQCALTDLTEAKPDKGVVYHPGSIYCWSLMLPTGYERHLLEAQHRKRVSIFACDQAAVYSNKRIGIARDVSTRVVDVDLQCESGGEFKTALNNGIFLAVWRKVIGDGDYLRHNWTVKVDPDTVFLPWRLRDVLKDHPIGPKGVYLNNCKYGLHGPLEVFSRGAVKAWGDGMEKCGSYFEELCSGDCWWGEDMYIDQCLCKVLGVRRDDSPKLLVESHCNPPEGWESCNDSELVAFHPFKEEKRWLECLDNADKRAPPPPTTTTSTTVTTSTTTRTVTSTTMTTTHTATSRTSFTEAAVHFDCNASGEQWRAEWSEGKMDWCCQRFGLGCRTEEDAIRFATNCAVTATWEQDWPDNKKSFCCQAYSLCEGSAALPLAAEDSALAPEPTSAPAIPAPAELSKGCSAQCYAGADRVSCSSFIQIAAVNQFADRPAPCAEALVEAITQCPACQACSLADAGCAAMPAAAAQPPPQAAPTPPPQALLAPAPAPPAPAAAGVAAAAWPASPASGAAAAAGTAQRPLPPSQAGPLLPTAAPTAASAPAAPTVLTAAPPTADSGAGAGPLLAAAPLGGAAQRRAAAVQPPSAVGWGDGLPGGAPAPRDDSDCEAARTPHARQWCCQFMGKGCPGPAGVLEN